MIKNIYITFLVWLLLSSALMVNAQTAISTEYLIDSLSLVEDRHVKTKIALEISNRLLDSEWQRSKQYLSVAENEATQSQSDSTLAMYHFEAGKIYQAKRATDIAQENFLLAYAYYKSIQDLEMLSIIENNLAIVYASQENISKSLEHFQNIYKTYDPNKDSLQIAKLYNNIGNMYFSVDLDSSLHYFLKSYGLLKNFHDNNLSRHLETNLARTYEKIGDQEAAGMHYEKALNYIDDDTPSSNAAWIYLNAGLYLLERDKIDSALTLAQLAEDRLNGQQEPSFREKINKLRYEAYDQKGDFESAAKYFGQYDSLRTMLFEAELSHNNERLQLLNDYRLRIQQQQLNANRKNFQFILVAIGMVSLIVILIMLYFRYKNHIRNARLKSALAEAEQRELKIELELKNKSLTLRAMNEIYKTNTIQEITKELQEAKLIAQKAETRNNIDKIIGRLKNNLDQNPWQEFETHFSEIHESFFQTLTTNHPELTPKDIRMCALLKMNLTTKEIAQLTGQSFKGVENARTRIRKKLDLTNQKTDISAYLNGL